MSKYSSPETGDFDNYFMTTTDLINNYFSGNLWSWGDNASGQLGDNTVVKKSSPIQVIGSTNTWKHIVVGGYQVSCIKTDGSLWMWGFNSTGQLGDNSAVNKSSPVQTIAGGTTWKQASCGLYNTLAIKTDGTLWVWGDSDYGQVGDNTITDRSSPVQTICGGTNWKQASAGSFSCAAIKTDGTLWTWGANSYGQLGDNSTVHRSSPVQTIAGGTNWRQVSCSNNIVGGYSISAIKTDGTLWGWGTNTPYGLLGDNSTVNRSSPVQTIAGGTNWKQIHNSGSAVFAIKTDGTLWGWGTNNFGQLGDNSTVNRSSPVQTIAGGTNWKQVSCGDCCAAIKTDGTLWTWGYNVTGQLGDNTIVYRSSPVQTIMGGKNWKQVSCRTGSMSAILIQE